MSSKHPAKGRRRKFEVNEGKWSWRRPRWL